jgi:hypothetical protein
MNKALVINNVESIGPSTCCNLLKKVDGFEKKVSEKLAIERKLTEKFNSFNGATFKGEKVNTHDLYVENLYSEEDTHGVFRFKQENKSNNYQLYFGPLIKVERKNLGCNTSLNGCKPSLSGCKPSFSGCKSVGCKSKGGDQEQKLNFLNDEKNQADVKSLNKFFGLRTIFKKEMDYKWDSGVVISLGEYVKNNIDQINDQFQKDMSTITSKGFGIHSVIDMPSEERLFTQALLFSNDSNLKSANVSNIESNTKTYLSRFDLWYFSRAKGLIEYLFIIPVIGWILKFLFGKKDAKIEGTSEISNENISHLEKLYSEEFDEQDSSLTEIENQTIENKIIAKTPVTIAVPMKMKWWELLFNHQQYTYHTFIVGCEK